MRYRKLTDKGDMIFGFGQADYYVNQPEAVAQAVLTRMKLFAGEWFLDITDGMDWHGKVLGNRTSILRDAAIKKRILDTPGVNSIISYQSNFDGNTRKFNVFVVLDTIFGQFPPQIPSSTVTTTTQTGPRITGIVQTGATARTHGVIGSGAPPPTNSGLIVVPGAAPGQPTQPIGTVGPATLHFELDNPADVLDGGAVLG
jgi:hypothetical protein